MQIVKIIILVMMICIISLSSYGYEIDYQLDDYFVVESFNTKNEKKGNQLWHIDLMRGLVDGKEAFIDFSLVVLNIVPTDNSKTYIIKDIETFEKSPQNGKAIFSNGIFNLEFGILRKLNLKIEFNKDGSLHDIKGSLSIKYEPDNVTTFKLIKKPRDMRIEVRNKLTSKDYFITKEISEHLTKKCSGSEPAISFCI